MYSINKWIITKKHSFWVRIPEGLRNQWIANVWYPIAKRGKQKNCWSTQNWRTKEIKRSQRKDVGWIAWDLGKEWIR